MRRASALLIGLLAVLSLATAQSAAAKQVHISGKAYEFNDAATHLANATIRVRELPGRTATTDADGDYTLRVPDDTDVTPFIDPPPGYNEIDLQTFHTRGEDIENANFQTPADFEYGGLAAILGVELGPDGRPTECVIVTTVSARNVRGVPFETFVERTPHGVAGATASSIPPIPGPTYFNDSVIPDPGQTESSGDGGIVWTDVPAGTYRLVAEHPTTRFASFLATCEPGRVVNANPPWGMYELRKREQMLGASIVAAALERVRVLRRGGRRVVRFRLDAGEAVDVRAVLRRKGKRLARKRIREFGPGRRKVQLRTGRRRGRAKLRVKLIDAAGESVVEKRRVKLSKRQR